MKLIIQSICSMLLLTFVGQGVFAQNQLDDFVKKSAAEFEQTATDISDYQITSSHVSKRSGITHYYLQQQYKGIPIYNAVMGVYIAKSGKLVSMENQFIRNIDSKINTTTASLDAYSALGKVADAMNYDKSKMPIAVSESERITNFSGGSFSRTEIPMQLVINH